jgi:guanylate kinase
MPGKMIAVTGLSGAGKSTLVAAVMQTLPGIHYLRTITTRPKRPGESDSYEYEFVGVAEYERRRQASVRWDHTEYQGYFYGADTGESKRLLAVGTNYICAIAPSRTILDQMTAVYGTKLIAIWIDTPAAVARERIRGDNLRAARQEDSSLRADCDYTFTPKGDVAVDTAAFTALIGRILS